MTQRRGQGNVAEAEGSSGRGGAGPAPTRLLQEDESSSVSGDKKAAAAHGTREQAMKKRFISVVCPTKQRYSSRRSPNCSRLPQPRQPVEEEMFQVQQTLPSLQLQELVST